LAGPLSGTFLITSGAYCGPEFTSIFGKLPPAFLPAGAQRLYQVQAGHIGGVAGRRILSLPEDFDILEQDRRILAELGFDVISVPGGLSLGQSVSHVLETADIDRGPLHILHGDTLLPGFPYDQLDCVSTGRTSEYTSWAESRLDETGALTFFDGLPDGGAPAAGERTVLSGFFGFSEISVYRDALKTSGNNFIKSLNVYAGSHPLSEIGDGEWLDFGHLDTYFQSKAQLTNGRAFNDFRFSRRAVEKTSADAEKINAEVDWFENVPADIKVFAPQYLGRSADGAGYQTEYLYLSSLADLMVFGRLPTYVWQRIFTACDEFLQTCARHRPDTNLSTESLYGEKTLARLDQYASQSGTNLAGGWTFNGESLPGLTKIVEICVTAIPPVEPHHQQIVHGDFCFSNIFYDFRAHTIRVVDPRGYLGEAEASIYGDVRYDIAKLYHSVAGCYDQVIAGRYDLGGSGADISLSLPDNAGGACRDAFFAGTYNGLTLDEAAAKPIAILLFLSMLPLHRDDEQRQRALLACALRLFRDLDG
jgi:hypothetical protein